ncbi:MAG: (Fe-S)-binding protein [Nitrososphaeria archaeon]
MNEIFKDLTLETSQCINCGFCEAVCPTIPAFDYRTSMGARGRINLAKEFLNGNTVLNFRDPFESCLDCYACFQVCPAHVNSGVVSELMKQAIAEGQVQDQEHQVARMITVLIKKYRDPLGLTKEVTEWSKGLEFDSSYQTILYTGHMYQLMAYNKKLGEMLKSIGELYRFITPLLSSLGNPSFIFSKFYDKKIKERSEAQLKNIYYLLRKAGVKFSYLGEEEPYPGTLMIDMGYVSDFKEYAQTVTDLFHKKGVKNIITVDPHTYDVLINKYKKYVSDFDFNVSFYLDHLNSLNLSKLDKRVTYHEPCHLVRHTDHNVPRDFIKKAAELTLPLHNGKNTYCCGGPIEAFYPKASEKISERRFRELKQTNAEIIVTSCPICFVNLYRDESVMDISELLIKLVK